MCLNILCNSSWQGLYMLFIVIHSVHCPNFSLVAAYSLAFTPRFKLIFIYWVE